MLCKWKQPDLNVEWHMYLFVWHPGNCTVSEISSCEELEMGYGFNAKESWVTFLHVFLMHCGIFSKPMGLYIKKKLTLCKFFKLCFSFCFIILALILSLLGAFKQDASFFDSLFSQTLCYGLSWNSFSSSAVKWLKVKQMMSLFSIGFWTPHQKVTPQFMSSDWLCGVSCSA